MLNYSARCLKFNRKINRKSKALYNTQMWCLGCDILYPKKNLLVEYGFAKSRPPPPMWGSSSYELLTQDSFSLTLWAFGVVIKHHQVGSLYIKRHEFDLRYSNNLIDTKNCFRPSGLAVIKRSNESNYESILILLQRLCQIFSDYELWLAKTTPPQYREKIFVRGKKIAKGITKQSLSGEWNKLALEFTSLFTTGIESHAL
jgi:hypothetical protein